MAERSDEFAAETTGRPTRAALRRVTGPVFGTRIAQKIFLGFALPLAVLLVAGILVPVFLWFSLDRFREEHEARQLLVQRVDALTQAAQDVETATRNLRLYRDDEFRNKRMEARDAYRDASLDIRNWLELRPDPVFQEVFERVNNAYFTWFRQANLLSERGQTAAGTRAPRFEELRSGFDQLSRLASQRRQSYAGPYRKAEVFRRIAAVGVPAMALVLALLIGRSIAISITRPLEDLTRAAEEMEQGDPERVPPPFKNSPDDEIGDLQRSFHQMARAIGQREAVLRAQNDALRAIRRRIEAVLNATNDGIVMLDRAGGFSVSNRRFAYFFGTEPEELQDRTFDQIRPLLLARFKNREAVREQLREVLRDPEATAEETYEIVHPEVRTIRLFTAPVRGEMGPDGEAELLGRIVVIRDVTRETEVDRMKTEFVSTVSHELRTPLTAIKGYVDLILAGKTGPLSELQSEFLTMVQVSTQRLTTLINDILDIARIESGRVEIRRETIDYSALVRQTVRMLTAEAEGRGVHLDLVDPPPSEGRHPAVLGDTERITQVLFNLVSNGLKYTPAGGHVTITVSYENNFVITCVADNGIGIAPDERERIFQRFYRADNSTTRESGGTGLGLAITKAVVERLGGSIWVESAADEGSKFWFTLPLSTSPAEPSPGEPGLPSKRRELFLVIDSETGALHRIAHALRPKGVITSTAATAAEALRRARGLRPDVLLLDPLTPGFDALALLKALRADPTAGQIPTLLYSLRQGSDFAELRDTLALIPSPRDDEMWEVLAATVYDLLEGEAGSGRLAAVAAIGDEAFADRIREAVDRLPVVSGTDPAEIERRLGPQRPLLLVAQTAGLDAAGTGKLLRRLYDRYPGTRLPVLLALEPALCAPQIAPLVSPSAGPAPIGRLARAARTACSLLPLPALPPIASLSRIRSRTQNPPSADHPGQDAAGKARGGAVE